MKRIMKLFSMSVAIAAIWGVCVFASGDATVAETHTDDEGISIYVRDIDADGEQSVQIGTSSAKVLSVDKVSDGKVSIRTLVMIDNSISIKKEQQERIAELLQDLIAGKMNGEKISIATFSEEVSYLTEYTDDYSTLKGAINGMEYQDQETYLTDVLYDILTKDIADEEEEYFYRIIIISDGVDNKSIGITKTELYELLKDNMFPIYTIGCKEKNNNEELENMFALSRITGGKEYQLDELEDTLSVVSDLSQDKEIVRFRIRPDAKDMDGSKKTVKLTVVDDNVSIEIRMPQQEMIVEEVVEEPELLKETVAEATSEEITEVEEEESQLPIVLLLGIGAVIVILVIALVVILILQSKKKNNNVDFETFSDDMEGMKDINNDEQTLMMGRTYELVLEDITNPARVFRTNLKDGHAVVVGRSRQKSDIFIETEPSVSGRHCEIGVRNGAFYIKDLQSSNGTYINDTRVITESKLIAGNIVRIGSLCLRVRIF